MAFAALATAAAVVLILSIRFASRNAQSIEPVFASKSYTPKSISAFELASGDRIETSQDARVRFVEADASDTVVVVEQGTVLFDVARRTPAQRFFVFAQQHVVEVTGTVFTVRVGEHDAQVELFEGHVNVRRADGACSIETVHACRDAVLVRSMNPGLRLAISGDGAASDAPRVADTFVDRALLLASARRDRDVSNTALASGQEAGLERDAASGTGHSRRDAERALAEGRYVDAAGIAREKIAQESSSSVRAAWWILLADAERGLGHRDNALEAYDRALAASTLAPTQRASLAVSLAQLCLQGSERADAERALAALREANATQPNSATERIAARLQVQALRRLERNDEAERLEALMRNRFGE